ncbi:HNH endonuclease signature motif containing protein [Pelagibius sp. CAU 1746]|uniref:HNH endonuclease signature motif containing protein n=1 Tax=Pelagibius sp. CAU 1746 TaxID=3140370 RepID=UPI00325BB2A7
MPTMPPTWRPPGAPTKRERDADYKRRRRDHPDQAFLRTRAWRDRLRPIQLQREPFCRHCAEDGRTVPATEVDHIVVPNGDPMLQRDPDNYQSLCKSCHARKTRAQQTRGAGQKG